MGIFVGAPVVPNEQRPGLFCFLYAVLFSAQFCFLAQPIQLGTSPVVSEDARDLCKSALGQKSPLD
jgi:hypothetical protein